MLYQRWELASRSRLAGAGFKLPGAAALRNGVVVNDCGKGILSGCQVSIEEMSESKPFDLTGSVWTNDINQAHRVASALDAGYLWINGSPAHPAGVPFGGVKLSGVGREESLD